MRIRCFKGLTRAISMFKLCLALRLKKGKIVIFDNRLLFRVQEINSEILTFHRKYATENISDL